MAETKKATITVNEVEYDFDSLTDQQKGMVSHLQDLDRKISSSQFNLDQLVVGRDAFINMLAKSLEEPKAE